MTSLVIKVEERQLFSNREFEYVRARLDGFETNSTFAISKKLVTDPLDNECTFVDRTFAWINSKDDLTNTPLEYLDEKLVERLAPAAVFGFNQYMAMTQITPLKKIMAIDTRHPSPFVLMITNFGGILLSTNLFEDHAKSYRLNESFPGKFGLDPFYRPILQNGLSAHEKLQAMDQIKKITKGFIENRPRSSLRKTSASYNTEIAEAEINLSLA
jgi:hypothetical protein